MNYHHDVAHETNGPIYQTLSNEENVNENRWGSIFCFLNFLLTKRFLIFVNKYNFKIKMISLVNKLFKDPARCHLTFEILEHVFIAKS